jgi:nucleoside-diphosphate-sugar epimerase
MLPEFLVIWNRKQSMRTIAELENLLSLPTVELKKDLQELAGDIVILGAGGKMGPSLSKMTARAFRELDLKCKIFAVSRFTENGVQADLERNGVVTIAGDLLDDKFLQSLPVAPNIIFMAGLKFGTLGNEPLTWALNTYLPARVIEKYRDSRIVAFSTGNVYPFMSVSDGGANEQTPVGPIGEYAQSCLGRERIFQYFSVVNKTPVLIFRLNYSLDLRYGILNEIGRLVWNERPIDLTMGYSNVIWQGDANAYALRALKLCETPARILNVTGPEIISIRHLAERFGTLMGKKPVFVSQEAPTALLSDASRLIKTLGKPSVTLDQMINWTVEWIKKDGAQLNKPTHFQERGGIF